MGAKIVFSFLSNSNKRKIFDDAFEALEKSGWKYNRYILGEYTYWLDAPIWQFGDSITKKEPVIDNTDSKKTKIKMIDLLSQYYSPVINLGIKICDLNVRGIFSIVEGDQNWKDISLCVDREMLIDTTDENIRTESIKILRSTFTDLCRKLKPFYGIGATECDGVENSPDKIQREFLLGDLNYFSLPCMDIVEFDINEADYEITDMGIGKSYILKDEIFKFE